MPTIISNKPLKYDPIRPQAEGIIELSILDVRDFTKEEITIVTIEDSIVIDGHRQQLNIRQKQFTFAELDALAEGLSDLIDPESSYMQQRLQLLEAGLLYVTQNDPSPIYFSSSEDWEIAE